MFQQMSRHLCERAEHFFQGRLSEVVSHYAMPMPAYLGDEQIVVRSREEAISMVSLLRDELLARGVVALRPTVKAMDLPRDGRFRVWVDWHEIAFPAEASGVSTVVYYCRQTSDGFQTEMMHYTRLAMPELAPQFAALALSA